MEKIIAFTVISCMLTGCSSLKPKEIAKSLLHTKNTEGSQPEGQGTGKNHANLQNRKSIRTNTIKRIGIYYIAPATVIMMIIGISANIMNYYYKHKQESRTQSRAYWHNQSWLNLNFI